MAAMKRKRRKAIAKKVRKVIKKHGPKIALGLLIRLVIGTVLTAADKSSKKSKRK